MSFLAHIPRWLILAAVARRREIQIKVVYQPTRMAAEHVRVAYELVVPVKRRRVCTRSASHRVDMTEAPPNDARKRQSGD